MALGRTSKVKIFSLNTLEGLLHFLASGVAKVGVRQMVFHHDASGGGTGWTRGVLEAVRALAA